MNKEVERMKEVSEVLSSIAKGINPLSGAQIKKGSLLYETEIKEKINYAVDVLQNNIEYLSRRRKSRQLPFNITQEQKDKIELPENDIGINEFAKYVNAVIDSKNSSKLSGIILNKQLRKMKILSEGKNEEGKIKTITNEKSSDYGIETEKRNFKGNEYEMILFNEKGKQFLLDNLEAIMSYEEEKEKIS